MPPHQHLPGEKHEELRRHHVHGLLSTDYILVRQLSEKTRCETQLTLKCIGAFFKIRRFQQENAYYNLIHRQIRYCAHLSLSPKQRKSWYLNLFLTVCHPQGRRKSLPSHRRSVPRTWKAHYSQTPALCKGACSVLPSAPHR